MVQRVYRQIKAVDQNARMTIATSNSQVSEIRMAMDAEYVDNASILLDLKIIFKTIDAVFKADGE